LEKGDSQSPGESRRNRGKEEALCLKGGELILKRVSLKKGLLLGLVGAVGRMKYFNMGRKFASEKNAIDSSF